MAVSVGAGTMRGQTRMHTRFALLMVWLVACGVQRSRSSATDTHSGELDCHGVLVPADGGGKRPMFLCGAGRNACESSKAEQAAKGYEVSDCVPHPSTACFPNGTGQMCLATMEDCRQFARAVEHEPGECTAFDSDAPSATYSEAYAGSYDSDRGAAVVLQRGQQLAITYAHGNTQGTMVCQIEKTSLACLWDEKGARGRARFAHQPDGSWIGTWGTNDSETGATWTFHRRR